MFQLNLKIKIFAVLLALAILNSCGTPTENGGVENNTKKIYKTDIPPVSGNLAVKGQCKKLLQRRENFTKT